MNTVSINKHNMNVVVRKHLDDQTLGKTTAYVDLTLVQLQEVNSHLEALVLSTVYITTTERETEDCCEGERGSRGNGEEVS